MDGGKTCEQVLRQTSSLIIRSAAFYIEEHHEFMAPCGFTQKPQITSNSEEIIHRLIYNLTIITNKIDKMLAPDFFNQL
jgi:hypothetical protein